MPPIISIENLGKKYTLRHQGAAGGRRYRRLSEELTNAIARPFQARGKTSQVSSSPLTPDTSGLTPASSEDFWSLRGVSFDVQKGEVLGIIGRNGAGKSTLLKILSRITEPSEGRATLRGRVASLLEVGTGFHPELTGRENIYLNGAILGMTRAEIRKKFDEIVSFAEVEKFLDTPVKHFSSGMYVRLAFAVAAHLEPEILVVDEVLAVGDAEFQAKCLGKMSQVAEGGRTVLFVSHNMAAVSALTTRCVVLNAGELTFDGKSKAAIEHYTGLRKLRIPATGSLGRGRHTVITCARLLDNEGNPTQAYEPGQPLHLEVTFETDGVAGLSLEAILFDASRQRLALSSLKQFCGTNLPGRAGCYRTVVELAPIWLASGSYSFDIATSVVNSNWDHYVEHLVEFDVAYSNPGGRTWDFKQSSGYGALALVAHSQPTFERT